MNENRRRWSTRLAALAMAGVCLCGGALAAGGDQDDPLVTLSYLTGTVTPDILAQVDAKAAQRQLELETSFNSALSKLQPSSADASAFTVVTLSAGQRLELELGCEVLLRVGSATVSAPESPALVDVTSGSTLAPGASLTANHLYLATIAGRSVTAQAETVKLLLRGGSVLS